MSRQLVDITRPRGEELEVTARPFDTYARPAKEPVGGELESIAEALTQYNPGIQKYLKKKDEEKKNFEEAVGAQIWQKLVAEGTDANAPEIKDMISRGEIEGFRKLTRNNWNGVVKARTAALGYSLEAHMQAWASTASLEDENGAKVPLSSIKDQTKVMNAYLTEQARWVQSTTGGQYDPVLYQELVQPKAENAVNIFVQQHASKLREQIVDSQVMSMTQAFDGIITPHIDENGFTMNKETTVQAVATGFKQTIDIMRASGMPEADINKAVEQYVTARLRAFEVDGIDGLVDIMKTIPSIWDNPDIRGRLTLQAAESRQSRMYNDSMKRRAKEEQEQATIDDTLNALTKKYGSYGNIPLEERNKILNSMPQQAGYLRQVLSNFDEAEEFNVDSARAMSPEAFDDLRLHALKHGLTTRRLSELYGSMNEGQRLTLKAIAEDHASARKSTGDSSGGGSTKVYAYEINGIENELKYLIGEKELEQGAADYEKRVNTKQVLSHYTLAAFNKLQIWKQKNPDMAKNRFALEATIAEIARETFTAIDSKNFDLAINDPTILNKKGMDVRITSLSERTTQRTKGFKTEALPRLQELQRRMRVKGFQPTEDDIKFVRRNAVNKEYAANPNAFFATQTKDLQELFDYAGKGN